MGDRGCGAGGGRRFGFNDFAEGKGNASAAIGVLEDAEEDLGTEQGRAVPVGRHGAGIRPVL